MNHDLSQFALNDFFNSDTGEFEIDQASLDNLVAIAGSTPFYVYSRSSIQRRISQLRDILPSRVGIHYAIKANPLPAIVQLLSQNVDGLDVASHGELLNALATGMQRDQISFAGPGKTDIELKAAISANIVINVESQNELLRISQIGETYGMHPKILLRVNPDFQLKTSGMKMAGGSKPFGIDSEHIVSTFIMMKSLNLDYHGLQYYFGSQNLSADNLIAAQNFCLDSILELSRKIDTFPRKINLGGGFGIPYFPGDKALNINPIAENLAERMEQIENELQCEELFLELGRYLVGEAGIYITKVIDKKISRGRTYLVVDGGLHQHLAATGNFGQTIKRHYPVISARNSKNSAIEKVTVVGPLCTPLDVLADHILLPKLEPGDYLAILQSGAYGPTASPLNFLSHNALIELLV